ncbi:MAG: hypothetical protein NT009_11965 [Proteobacteria bacterium]|nr:hypothetical protein [Pseudomonadota bacterium]
MLIAIKLLFFLAIIVSLEMQIHAGSGMKTRGFFPLMKVEKNVSFAGQVE